MFIHFFQVSTGFEYLVISYIGQDYTIYYGCMINKTIRVNIHDIPSILLSGVYINYFYYGPIKKKKW